VATAAFVENGRKLESLMSLLPLGEPENENVPDDAKLPNPNQDATMVASTSLTLDVSLCHN